MRAALPSFFAGVAGAGVVLAVQAAVGAPRLEVDRATPSEDFVAVRAEMDALRAEVRSLHAPAAAGALGAATPGSPARAKESVAAPAAALPPPSPASALDPDVIARLERLESALERIVTVRPGARPPSRDDVAVAKDREALLDPRRASPARAEALGRLRGTRELAEPAVAGAVAEWLLNESSADVRVDILRHVGRIRDTRLVAAMVDRLARDADEKVRAKAAETLGKIHEAEGVRDALTRAAEQDVSPRVRLSAQAAMLGREVDDR